MSVNPTEYDVIQDTAIDELKEIVTTTYQAPDQVEYSYPVVDQPMNDEQWQYVTLALGSGVLDEGGRPYWLELNGSEANTNSTNSMVLTVSTTTGTAQAAVRGFYHRLLTNKIVNFPGVTSETTYYVVLKYDPLGHKEPTGPISSEVVTTLGTSQGKFNLVLWEVTRQPNQLLTDATVRRIRPHLAPMVVFDRREDMPSTPTGYLWGTLAVVTQNDGGLDTAIYRAAGLGDETGSPTTWVPLVGAEWLDSTSVAFPGAPGGVKPARRVTGDRVELRGRVIRSDGSSFAPGQTYTLVPNVPDAKGTLIQNAGSDSSRQPVSMDAVNGEKPTFRVKNTTPYIDLTGFFYYWK